jgi:hypothetical protein
MYDAYVRAPRILPRLPELWRLSLEVGDNHGHSDAEMINLCELPSLEELYLVAPRNWNPSKLCTGFSQSISKVVMMGGFGFTSTTAFCSFLHRLGTDNIDRLSLKDIFINYPPDPTNLPLMLGLRTLECIGLEPMFLWHMCWSGIRKILVESHKVLPTQVITKILHAARLVSFSVITHPCPINANSRFTSEAVRALCSNRNLKHFQSIGPYFFADHDWKNLHCTMKSRLKLFHVVHPGTKRFREKLEYPSSSEIKELRRFFLRESDNEGDFTISQDLLPQPLVFDPNLRRVRRRFVSRS